MLSLYYKRKEREKPKFTASSTNVLYTKKKLMRKYVKGGDKTIFILTL